MRAPPPPPRVEKKRPKAPPPKPVYVAPPAPWQATRPAPVDFRNIKEDRPPSPPAPVRPATLKLPPWSANPWGTAPQPPAALTKDFPALAQPRTPLILRVPVSERERPKKGFLKPKPQRNFVVFDVLAAKKKKEKKVVPKAKVPEVVQPPPRLAPGKVRKKRLSSLKKRILLERQEKYYDLHPEMRPATMVREEVPWEAFVDATGLEKRFVVRVENACTALELEDEEERAEILTDVGDICASYAEVIAVEVGDESADFVPIDVSFASRDEALKALAGLQKRVVGGLVLQAEPLRPPAKDASCALRVYDALDEDEFEDEDCRDEVLEDLSRLACVHGALATPPEVVAGALHVSNRDVRLTFETATCALKAQRAFAQTTIGGSQLQCDVEVGPRDACVIALLEALSSEDLADDETRDEALSDLRKLIEQKAQGVLQVTLAAQDVLVRFPSERLCKLARDALSGVVLGGQLLNLRLLNAEYEPVVDPALIQDKLCAEEAVREALLAQKLLIKNKRGETVRLPKKYAAARDLPKPARDETSRDYASHPRDGVLDAACAAVVSKLFEFQERGRLRDPIKAKMRRRLVFGLREVRRGVRAANVKCLVVAPNVSDGTELARQVNEILDGAATHKIPVAFALGKRRLGKALRKQSASVVAIYTDDGAVDEYRAMIRRLDEILLDPSKAVPPGAPKRESKKKKAPAPAPKPSAKLMVVDTEAAMAALAALDGVEAPPPAPRPATNFGALAADATVFVPGAWGS